MILLVDTHLVLWSMYEPDRVPLDAASAIDDPSNEVFVSAASLWEVGIKAALGRPDFTVDPRVLRRSLRDGGWVELAMTGEHALAAAELPPIHRDPFDRMLVAQARAEGAVLLTSDRRLAEYGSPARLVTS